MHNENPIKNMGRREDGCVLIPFILIWYLIKLAIAIGAYALAGIMTFCTLFYLPLIIIVALFKGSTELIFQSLSMWFALAHKFSQKLFEG